MHEEKVQKELKRVLMSTGTGLLSALAVDLSSEPTAFPFFEILSSMRLKRGLMGKSRGLTLIRPEKQAPLHPTVLCWYVDLGNQSIIFLILHETVWMELAASILVGKQYLVS